MWNYFGTLTTITVILLLLNCNLAEESEENYSEENDSIKRIGLFNGRGLFSISKPVYLEHVKHNKHHNNNHGNYGGWKGWHGNNNNYEPEHHLHRPPPRQIKKGWNHNNKNYNNHGGWKSGWSKVPHYVKYWASNSIPKGQKVKPKNWKLYQPAKLFSFDQHYWTDLAERLADGIGVLPEYSEKENHGDDKKHGKYLYNGITIHNGFFTEVL